MLKPSLARRIAAFLVILVGTLLYCYNFNVPDYVRPYLIQHYGFSIAQTADLNIAQNIGVTVGAFAWASILGRIGYRATVATIFATMATFALFLAIATGYWPWVAGRGLLSIALGGFSVVTSTAVVAMFPAAWRGRLLALTAATYPLSNVLLGALGSAWGDAGWHALLWVGVLPILLVPLAWLIPRFIGSDFSGENIGADARRGSWREMLSPRWRWRTLGCAVLAGIDFNAYQLFAAFLTLYLRQVRHAGAVEIGATVSILSAASMIGAMAWAWLSDRMGRRWAAFGYITAGLSIIALLFGGAHGILMAALVASFGFGLACNSAWGPWFVELFPDHLRPHGAALFHAGHIIAMVAPLFVTLSVARFGLIATMAVAAPVYFAGALLWFALPETVGRGGRPIGTALM